MKLLIASRLATAALALTSLCAVAQMRFCLGGDLSHLSPGERASCSAKMQAAKAEAAALHAPENWHFVMVCGAEGWESYASFVGGAETGLINANANTVLASGETFLRSDRLDLNQPRILKQIVAHEVAGILLHSNDEQAIVHQMELWTSHSASAGI